MKKKVLWNRILELENKIEALRISSSYGQQHLFRELENKVESLRTSTGNNQQYFAMVSQIHKELGEHLAKHVTVESMKHPVSIDTIADCY